MSFHFRQKEPHSIIEKYNPESAGVVEIQRLFNTLYHKGGSKRIKSLMVTSAMPQEGKSTLVGYLGLVAAYANLRTVILDADMRRPFQHHLLQMPRFPGLTDYLQKEAELDQVIHSTKLENLKLIPGGNTVSSPTELLQIGISDVKVLLDQCYIHFDVVLVDVPPVVPVHDAESLGPLVDGVALIVMSGKTYREIIERAVELLQKSDCHLLGLILNNMTSALPYYYEPKSYRYPYTEEK